MKRTCRKLFNQIAIFLLTVVCTVGVFGGVPSQQRESAAAETYSFTPGENVSALTETGSTGSFALEGLGSYESPFLISTLQDFILLRNYVNDGSSFKYYYFRQTANIDLSMIANFVPIGTEETPFEGTYDGNGYTISSLTVSGADKAGLFAYMNGTLMNLGIQSGTIQGNVAASFVVKGSSASKIYNCYSTANVIANTRAGGIVDTTSGEVHNCWYYSPLTNSVPLVGNTASDIAYCFAERVTKSSFSGNRDACYEYDSFFFREQEFVDMLNLGRAVTLDNLRMTDTELKCWIYRQSGTPVMTQAERTWKGKGTKDEPYLIESAEDFVMLSVRVNQGMAYESTFFQQTGDLDFAPVYNLVPIGIYESSRYFFGTYDGGGYKLENVVIRSLPFSYNNALFGLLGGTVRNVFFASGEVYGANCASIASHGVNKNALVLNCYSSASIYGESRSGGIVDNFTGCVYNSVYCNYNQQYILLCGFSAYELKYCYSTGGIYDERTMKGDRIVVENCGFFTADTSYKLTEFEKNLNENIVRYAQSYRMSITKFAKWKRAGDRFAFDGNFEVDALPDDIQSIINEHYTDTLVVIKLVLCATVVIIFTVVLDVLLKRRKKNASENAKKGK